MSDFTDEEVRAWMKRHDINIQFGDARQAFEDAATAHLLRPPSFRKLVRAARIAHEKKSPGREEGKS